jgi:class 3 adenylate cyclase
MISENQVPQRFRELVKDEVDRYGQPKTVQVRNEIPDTDDIPFQNQNHWLRIPDVVCVFVDMKNSTKLSAYNQDKTTAGIYQFFTGTAVRLLHSFQAAYIDVKGDGAFGLFNSDEPHRALAAAVTLKTFIHEEFVPRAKRDSGVDLGSHLGIDQRTVLVRKIGLKREGGRTDRQNEVWAGKPVNMASKLASRSAHNELLVSDRFFKSLSDKRALMSCGCPGGIQVNLWTQEDVRFESLFDFDSVYKLSSNWCVTHGAEYCQSLINAG